MISPSKHASAPATPMIARRRRAILITMCLGVLMAQIDTSVVNLAARQIGQDLHASLSQLQWVIDAYNLAYATLLLSGGALGDLFGRRRLFLAGVTLFALGSAMCG
ncbi:MAG: MFS transporter, partial [Burkholderiales bacterium]|nr:MFS transporter [Burkholderiales bacterium]